MSLNNNPQEREAISKAVDEIVSKLTVHIDGLKRLADDEAVIPAHRLSAKKYFSDH